MKVVTITGFAGFIGSYVTRECLKKGWYVHGIDSYTYAANPKLGFELIEKYPNNFKYNIKNINNLDDLYDCDYFINICAETHVDNSIENSQKFFDTNVKGVYNLLELIRKKNKYKRPIFLEISTDEVYGDIIKGSHKETDILKPSNPYSATKSCGDILTQAWCKTFDINYLIIRPTNNYGIGQNPEKLIPRAIKYFNLGKKISIHNQGTPIRTWLHASDTAEAILKIIDLGVQNEIFNISGGEERTNIDVINLILENYLKSTDYKIDDYVDFSYNRPGQDIRYSLDDTKLRSLGWSPKMKFEEEIPKIIEYYKGKFVW